MGGAVWEVVGGKEAGGITVRTGKDLKSPEATGGRLSHGAIIAELELDGERMRFTRLSGEGPTEGWVSMSFKGRAIVVRSGEKGSKAAKEAKELEVLKANGGVMQPKEGGYRLWLFPQGSRGDVQPILALAIAARKAGWAVHFFASPENKEFVTSYGFRFTACGVDVRESVGESTAKFDPNDEKVQQYKEDQGKMGGEAVGELFNKEAGLKIGEVLMGELEQAKKEEALPDAIFYHGLAGHSVWAAWKKYGILMFQVDYVTNAYLSDEMWKEHYLPRMRECGPDLKERFGIDDPFEGVSDEEMILWCKNRVITCSSALSIYAEDFAKDLDEEVIKGITSKFCGPMVMEPTDQMVDLGYFGGQETLKQIQDFLDAGAPPAYVGWGSMPMPYPMLMKVVTNVKFIKQRVIILGGWAKFNKEGFCKAVLEIMPEDPFGLVEYINDQALFVDVAPHEWLFQRCAFTIHHGGAGTTQAALRSGRPTIITPFSFDQFHYAKWVVNLGVGATLSLVEGGEKMMDPLWTKTFRKVNSDATMLATAKEVAEKIRKERGAFAVLDRIKEGIEMKQRGETEGMFGG